MLPVLASFAIQLVVLMVLSAVTMDSSYQVVDLVRVGESKKRKNNCMLRYAILTEFHF